MRIYLCIIIVLSFLFYNDLFSQEIVLEEDSILNIERYEYLINDAYGILNYVKQNLAHKCNLRSPGSNKTCYI